MKNIVKNKKRFVFCSALIVILSLVFCLLLSKINTVTAGKTDNLDVYFFQMGYDADACIIDIGEIEILVDFGCKHNKTNNKVQDCPLLAKMREVVNGKWDYVIATHGDADHIRGAYHIFDYLLQVGLETIIEFDHQEMWTTRTMQNYKNVAQQMTEKHGTQRYTASDWLHKSKEGKLGKDATLTILDTGLYSGNVSIKNQASVCFLIEYGSTKLLYTGDLQETTREGESAGDGETKLIQRYSSLISNVTFYKTAHHGSSTSSSKDFIKCIAPKYAYVPVVADGDPHHGLAKATLDNIFLANPDAKVYIPEEYYDGEIKAYHGNVCFSFDSQGNATVKCDYKENDPITISNYETLWDRLMITEMQVVFLNINVPNGKDHCTLLKYGDKEILIDCGLDSDYPSQISNMDFVEKVAEYCTDGILECVVITNSQTESLSQFIGNYLRGESLDDGISSNFEIESIINFDDTTEKSPVKNSWLYNYNQQVAQLEKNGTVIHKNGKLTIDKDKNFNVHILSRKVVSQNENDYSVCVLITFNDKKMLFTGDLTNGNGQEDALVDLYGDLIKDVTIFRAGCDGYCSANSDNFMKHISPQYIAIAAPLNSTNHGYTFGTQNDCRQLLKYTKNVYATSAMIGNEEKPLYQDIIFKIKLDGTILVTGTAEKLITVEEYLKGLE